MCQVMCVRVQKAALISNVRGGMCAHVGMYLSLSRVLVCVCSFISTACHHSNICAVSSQHSVVECVNVRMYPSSSTCVYLKTEHMRLVRVSLQSGKRELHPKPRRVPAACSSALELSGTPLKLVSCN